MRLHVADPCPGQMLSDITSLSTRARSWLSRVVTRIPEDESIQVVGAIAMLEGLDYHHDEFMKLVIQLTPYYARILGGDTMNQVAEHKTNPFPTAVESKSLDALDHEAVAYLNRLGQLHSFAKAKALATRMPKARELVVFRNKHTAHRSIDAPKGDSRQEQEYQAMTVGFYRLTRSGFPSYQITVANKPCEFHMGRDHPIVMQEATDALFGLYP